VKCDGDVDHDGAMLECCVAEVAFALNRFGPICRAEGETQQEVSDGDIKVGSAASVPCMAA